MRNFHDFFKSLGAIQAEVERRLMAFPESKKGLRSGIFILISNTYPNYSTIQNNQKYSNFARFCHETTPEITAFLGGARRTFFPQKQMPLWGMKREEVFAGKFSNRLKKNYRR